MKVLGWVHGVLTVSWVLLLDPDIDPSWYTGRGIRPVGRFGRRQATAVSTQKSGYGHRQACFPIGENSDFMQNE